MVGEARAFTALQGDMAAVRPPLETIHHIGNARTPFSQVRGIDLRNVPQAYHFSARTGSGNQGFHLFWREILRFVDNQVFI